MRLRSRSSLKSNTASQAAIDAPSAAGVGPQPPSARSVLGDVSNKKRGGGSDTTEGQIAKRPKKTLDVSLDVSLSNDENALENFKSRENDRRASSRIKKKLSSKSKKSRTLSRASGRDETDPINPERFLKRHPLSTEIDSDCEDETEYEGFNSLRVPDENVFIAPSDCRLYRRDFDLRKHTHGYASYDMKDKDDVLKVANYVTDLFQHLYKAESESAPSLYMDSQKDINAKMRAILVDWLVEVHMKFRLVPETLFLCVNIIDRYCNKVAVARSKLQLVGVTALLIACKYEEIYPPEVRDCVYITDRAYQRQEVLDMEQHILECLQFKITVPTAYPFLLRFLDVANASRLVRYAAHYYTERTLQEHDLLAFRPSVVCAASVVLALNNPDIQRQEKDNEEGSRCAGLPAALMEYTGFESSEILACSQIIAKKVAEEPVTASRRQLIAVKRKYDNRKYLHVSTAVEQPNHLDIIGTVAPGPSMSG